MKVSGYLVQNIFKYKISIVICGRQLNVLEHQFVHYGFCREH